MIGSGMCMRGCSESGVVYVDGGLYCGPCFYSMSLNREPVVPTVSPKKEKRVRKNV